MFKKLFLTLAFCLFSTTFLFAQNWEPSEQANYHSSIIKLKGDGYSGSGTVIKYIEDSRVEGYYYGLILTASHVIHANDTRFTLFFSNGRTTEKATVFRRKSGTSSFNDIALIRGLIPDDIKPMETSTEDVPIGKKVEMCGYGAGDFRHWEAIYGGEGMSNEGHIVFSWAIQGDSGGPIIYKGKVIGVICFGVGVKEYKDTERIIVGPIYGTNISKIELS